MVQSVSKNLSNITKKSDNICWSCGYGVSKNHTSLNCQSKRTGHTDWHTGDIPASDHNPKNMEHLKWKDNAKNKPTSGKKDDFN